MTTKGMSAIAVGTALTMAAGAAAYMGMQNSHKGVNMKKMKKTTGKALKTVGGIVTDLSNILG